MTSAITPPDGKGETDLNPVTLSTSDGQVLEFGCASGQSVLDAAAASGYTLPASCRQGTCGACLATTTSGEFQLGSHSEQALPPHERDGGSVLLCRTYPEGPLSATLPYENSRILHGQIPVRDATIVSLDTVGFDTVRLELQLEPDDETGLACMFEPGQYMDLEVPGQDAKRSYSLANTGNWEGRLEFLIRLRPGGLFSAYLRELAREGDRLRLHGPQGAFGLHETGLGPRWFVAGGTGLAAMLSMVRRMAEWQDPQPARLIFGVTGEQDVFAESDLADVAKQLPGFQYDLCVWRPGPKWQGRCGTPADALHELLPAATVKPDIYVCGPPPLVDAVVQVAAECGVPADRIFRERFLPT